jgi:hypothetical protein
VGVVYDEQHPGGSRGVVWILGADVVHADPTPFIQSILDRMVARQGRTVLADDEVVTLPPNGRSTALPGSDARPCTSRHGASILAWVLRASALLVIAVLFGLFDVHR